ncbi:hypothetical protein M427DRAFT_472560 [Gonapodya prolifera JEL478]|uniref:Uncharacterized protein n=1 Tax=Gonapodya prolifera (strain JEL478) TaxID=1344416 RepID=A0A139AR73_GONPJ|nr:hypothetical protein M427DRAFT_472560 [Gonapodya prolifera JEL478]|eukprot:KXS19250.1 hypothetical protein M427DRAFT_472560 [Gonapodya prolifera JEL478]
MLPRFFQNLGRYYETLRKLQKGLDKAAGGRQGVIGNIAWLPSQVYYYARAAAASHVKTICEVGYGAGHSSVLYLTMNPKAHLYSFDIFPVTSGSQSEVLENQNLFQSVSLKYIREYHGSRFTAVSGDSNTSIPEFARKHPHTKCDLISIDGAHIPPQPFFDILHFRALARPESIMVLDDMEFLHPELQRAVKEGFAKERECLRGEAFTDREFANVEYYTSYVKAGEQKMFCSAQYLWQ